MIAAEPVSAEPFGKGYHLIAQAVRLLERKPEGRADNSRCHPDDDRQEREHEQAAVPVGAVRCVPGHTS
jgi:hypothetical protein